MDPTIYTADDLDAVNRCFPVISQLRPHLSADRFAEQVSRQRAQGYRLAYLQADGQVKAVAGYRYFEALAWGRICYVDDLVTDAASRSQAYGTVLFDWLLARAREEGCDELHLDSGVQRFDAHRFYLARRMAITSHHFAISLR